MQERAAERMKRIALFFPSEGTIGGAERRLVKIFDEVSRQDAEVQFEIILLLLGDTDEAAAKAIYAGMTDSKVLTFRKKRDVFRAVRAGAYDIVCYTDCSYRCLPVLHGALRGKKKRLMICVNTVGSSQQLKPWLRQRLYNLDIRFSDRIDCLYPSYTELLKKLFPKKPITCTPGSFTDPDRFRPKYPKQKRIVFLGRLIEIKGIQLFVDAMCSIAQEIREAGFVCEIYGDGALKEQLQAQIEKDGCEEVIRLKGRTNDSRSVLEDSMIFCSLQPFGNYPSQSLLEAMACGNYCIVTDTGDSRCMIRPDFGELVPQSADAVAQSVLKAIRIPQEEYERIADSARAFIQENHSLNRSAAHYSELFAMLSDESTDMGGKL